MIFARALAPGSLLLALVVVGCEPSVDVDVVAAGSAQALLPSGAVGGYDPARLISAGVQPRANTAQLLPDGSAVLFVTPHPLVDDDGNERDDLYLLDYQTGIVRLISQSAAGGRAANGPTSSYVLSGDGTTVAFTSTATDLVGNDTNGAIADIFVRRLALGSPTELVSANIAGGSGDQASNKAVISDDGNVIAFLSSARNLTTVVDTQNIVDVFVRDLRGAAPVTSLASINAAGNGPANNNIAGELFITAAGDTIVFTALATNLTTSPPATRQQAYQRTLGATPVTTMLSVDVAGTAEANQISLARGLSADGSTTLFITAATNVVSGVTVSQTPMFARRAGVNEVVNINLAGTASVGTTPLAPSPLARDGSFVVFQSDGAGLTAIADNNNQRDIFVRRLGAGGSTTMISVNAAGTAAGNANSSTDPLLSADDVSVVFISNAQDIVAGDAQNPDLFLRPVLGTTTTLLNLNAVGAKGNSGVGANNGNPVISANAGVIAYGTFSTDLVVGDVGTGSNVGRFFVRRRLDPTPTNFLMAVRQPSSTLLTGAITGINDQHVISGDGRFAAFVSNVPDLVAGDTNATADVFRQNLITGAIDLVSANATGDGAGDSQSLSPRISDDGNVVVFFSRARNLVSGIAGIQGGGTQHIYARTFDGAPTTKMIDTAADGVTASSSSSFAAFVAGDGSVVVFGSQSNNIVSGQGGFAQQTYVRDSRTLTPSRMVSALVAGGSVGGNARSFPSAVSRDGTRVVWDSAATDLVSNDSNGAVVDVFAAVLPNAPVLISLNKDGTGSGDLASQNAFISADGQFVTFQSAATNLVVGDTNARTDIFVSNIDAGAPPSLVSINSAGTNGGDGDSINPRISADGGTIAFESSATNLQVGLTSQNNGNLYARILGGGAPATKLVNISRFGGGNAGFGVAGTGVSADGSMVFFSSSSANLVEDDDNTRDDIFVRRIVGTPVTAAISVAPVGTIGNVASSLASLSQDARRMVFLSSSSNLIAGDRNNEADVVLRRLNFDEPPVVPPLAFSTLEDTPLLGRVRAFDAEGFVLLFATYGLVDGPTKGALSLRANGGFTYTPNANTNGTDTFSFNVTNGPAFAPNVVVTITVDPANDAPTATAASFGAIAGQDLGENVTGTDIENDPLTFALVKPPTKGAIDFSPTGAFVYSPPAGASGADSFTFIALDDDDASVPATISLTITGNSPPTTTPPTVTTNEDTQASGTLTANDVDGDPLVFALLAQATRGTAVVAANGNFTYTPTANLNGGDSFSYTVSDGTAAPVSATVNVTVTPVNDLPIATAASVNAIEDTPLGGQLAATDIENDTLTFALVAPATKGVVVVNANGSFTYTPNADTNGADSFSFRANDPSPSTAAALITIDVAARNDAPTATPATVVSDEDAVSTGNLIATDVDVGDTLTFAVAAQATKGAVVVNANGSFSYTPNSNSNGTDSFTFTASDGTATTTATTLTLTVNPINDLPIATAATVNAIEDTPLGGQLAGTDIENDSLTFALVSQAAKGVVVVNADGSFTYTPNADTNGADTFSFRANDPSPSTAAALITVNVAARNDTPTGITASASGNEDSPIGGTLTANDVDGDTPTFALVAQAQDGVVVVNGDGSFTYTPRLDFNGSDTFTFTASDATTTSAVTNAALTVNAVNDPPSASDGSLAGDEDGVLSGQLVATDVDNTLTFALAAPAANGDVVVNPDGSFTFTPDSNFNGTDAFTFTATDGTTTTAPATISLTVASKNDAPTATPATPSGTEDAVLSGQLAANDVDGDPLTFVLGAQGANGTAIVNTDGSFTYTPVTNFSGTDRFTFTATDGTATTGATDVNVTITGANDAPTASAAAANGVEDAAIAGQLEADDVDGDALTFALGTQLLATKGRAVVNADGTFTYTPNANANGDDAFSFTVTDGTATTAETTVSVTLAPSNDTPTTTSGAASGDEGSIVSGQLTADDVDGDTLTFALATAPANGSALVNANGSFTYTPIARFNGTDSFTFTASDATTTSTTATLTITLGAVNDAPTADAAAVSGNEDAVINGQLTGSDPDGDTLSFALAAQATRGIAVVNADGSFTYTPTPNLSGPDSFTFTASDGTLTTTPTTVSVVVNARNDAPTGNTTEASGLEDAVISGVVTGNDIDGDALTFALRSQGEHGVAVVNANGSFTYTPAAGFNGGDTFKFTVNDGTANSSPTTVTITITPRESAPRASAQLTFGAEDGSVSGQLVGTDDDGDALVFALATGTQNGATVINADGSFTYTPIANFSGVDSFTFTVSDGTTTSAPATVTVSVTAGNDAPTTTPPTLTIAEDGVATGQLVANDIDGDALVFSLVTQAARGTAVVNADGSFTYTPAANDSGAVQFSYAVNDNRGSVVVVVVDVTISAANDTPAATGETIDASAGPVSGQLAANDVDGDALTFTLATQATQGTVVVNANGSFTYTPNAGATGTDSFTFTVSDATTTSTPALVSITLPPIDGDCVASVPTTYVWRGSPQSDVDDCDAWFPPGRPTSADTIVFDEESGDANLGDVDVDTVQLLAGYEGVVIGNQWSADVVDLAGGTLTVRDLVVTSALTVTGDHMSSGTNLTIGDSAEPGTATLTTTTPLTVNELTFVGDEIVLGGGTALIVESTWTAIGTDADVLSIVGGDPPEQWSIDPQGGVRIDDVEIRDSENQRSSPVVGANVIDLGNNSGIGRDDIDELCGALQRHDGDAVLLTDDDVTAFNASLAQCITGDLIIAEGLSTVRLENLVNVLGNLIVLGPVEGDIDMPELIDVGGDVSIPEGPAEILLPGLERVGGDLQIEGDPEVNLDELTRVGGNLEIPADEAPAGYECVDGACGSVCGDGFLRDEEACDDLNTRSGDGCDALCAIEPAPEPKPQPPTVDTVPGCGCNQDGNSGATSSTAALLLLALLRRRRRIQE
ncbi:MAG: Ig-like domain-containing protein [Deltaproteobacteria bacterium]|nr:Ig-like domain-containing protein [Deltaproteobacteria bacterium]